MIAIYLTHPMPLDLMTSLYLVNDTFYGALRRLHVTSCYVGPVFCLAFSAQTLSLFSDTQSILTQSVLRHPVYSHSVCS